VAHLRFRLRLDGRLSLQLHGPTGTDYDLRLVSGPNHARTGRGRDDGSHDRLAYAEACRSHPTATVLVAVLRNHGAGPFRLQLGYAG
jgi:hypothetical protein